MKDVRASIPATNYWRGRAGTKIDTIVFHHIVGDAPAAIARFRTKGIEVSSTYVIGKDGQIYYVVSEGNTPFTNGDADWNRRSITIEHAGGHASVPYTAAMYKASIALVRDIRKRHNIKYFKRHRDIVATACPGGLDVERIIRNSNPGSKPAPKPASKPQGGKKMTKKEATALVTALYKRLLKRNPDKGGLNNYVSHILKGRFDFVVKDIASSAEFKQKNVKTVTKTKEIIKEVKVGDEEAVRGFFGRLIDLVFKKVK